MESYDTLPALHNEQVVLPWGEAHERRGAHWHEAALKFADRFPIGTQLSGSELDAWMFANQLVSSLPPHDALTDSDAWMAHMQRRYGIRRGINTAASHPRLRNAGREPFAITTVASHHYVVQSTYEAITQQAIPSRIA